MGRPAVMKATAATAIHTTPSPGQMGGVGGGSGGDSGPWVECPEARRRWHRADRLISSLISRTGDPDLDLCWPRGRKMVLLADHLVGRVEELGVLGRVLAGLGHGRAAAIELVGVPHRPIGGAGARSALLAGRIERSLAGRRVSTLPRGERHERK
jgi:hypothetical protein